ncbi:MAG: hypothetical protein Q9222_003002 [Ikaeria aurantiellina]
MATEKQTDNPPSELPSSPPPPPYSAFTTLEKRITVALAAYAAWFSTLTSFIYYPIIAQLARTFSVSVDKINLTVTSYMAVATIAPMLVGDAADILGRRPVYMVALSVYIGANVAIVLADEYKALVGLRVVQAVAISVGNGSIGPPKYLRLPWRNFMCHWDRSEQVPNTNWQAPNPLRSLEIMCRKDNAVVMLAAGLLYVVYTCTNTPLSVLLIDIYKLNEWEAGLVYLPFGVGGIGSTLFTGPLINKAYRDYRARRGLSIDKVVGDDLHDFAIEKARLRIIWPPLAVAICSVIAFGWVVQDHQVRLLAIERPSVG